MKLFETVTLTDTELAIVKDKLTDVTVVKYLRNLAFTAISEVVSSPELLLDNNELYIKKQAYLMGNVEVIQQLINLSNTEVTS